MSGRDVRARRRAEHDHQYELGFAAGYKSGVEAGAKSERDRVREIMAEGSGVRAWWEHDPSSWLRERMTARLRERLDGLDGGEE